MYRNYTQEELDAQYNLRAKYPDFQEHFDRWERDSAEARKDLLCDLDIRYGDAPGETLDLFPAAKSGCPVHVFIHGGYWQFLGKKDFSFAARTLVGAGCTAVVIDYALAPGPTMDEIVRQTRNAVAWCYRNAPSFGGDPNRISVSGHSAGGHLTAMALLTDWESFGGLPADLIKSGCAISGLFDLEPIRLAYLNEVLGMDEDMAARNSPMHQAPPTAAPLTIAVGGLETEEFLRQSEGLAGARREWGLPTEHRVLDGHDHFTIIEELARPDTPLSRALLDQIV